MAAPDVGTVADVATALTLFAALVFGGVQIREHQRRRRDEGAIMMIRSFQDEAFVRAVRIVWRLPLASRARDVSADREVEEAATQLCNALSGVGYVVHRRIVPLDVADDTLGMTALVVWSRLERWVHAVRRAPGGDEAYRWLEWFVHAVAERRGTGVPSSAATPPGAAGS